MPRPVKKTSSSSSKTKESADVAEAAAQAAAAAVAVVTGAGVEETAETAPSGHRIKDFISGQMVLATPEEVDAVQVFAHRLVEDYGYPKAHIQTRPQYRVRRSPSDEKKHYPVDLAVFTAPEKIEDNLYMVVECKKKNRTEGEDQLKLYMDMSRADIGVWFNGKEHLYLRKVVSRGRTTYVPIPNIPRFGQRVEDVGQFARKDLRAPGNLKAIFRDIRHHLAGNAKGVTKDERLVIEMINLLFCKIYDELNTAPKSTVEFRAGVDETHNEVRRRILGIFEKVKTEYSDVFSKNDTIKLKAPDITYVVGELQSYCITQAHRDAVGDAFEVFIGSALRGPEGQFFTPRNVVEMIVSILDPSPGQLIIDPACGSGGFLVNALADVWAKVEEQGRERGWTEAQTEKRKQEVASKAFRGIDKDEFLAKVTKAYLAIIGDGRGGVFCENSLEPTSEWDAAAQSKIELGTFDVVLSNPPFGKNLKIEGEQLLSQFDLGHRWKREGNGFKLTTDLEDNQVPQLLFLERCLQLLKDGGSMGIVIPESLFGSPSYEYVIAWLLAHVRVRCIIALPEATFKTSGKGGTHTKVCVLIAE
jgi:type I restriction enzyme M protein